MELKQYFEIIRKRYLIILAITLISTITSGIVSYFFLDKVYEANTTLYVGRQADTQTSAMIQELQMGQSLVKDYREIAKSRKVVSKVKEELKAQEKNSEGLTKALELSDEAFSGKISVNLKNETRIIEVKVEDEDPVACTIIANKVAEVFKEQAVQLLKVENIQIVDGAVVPQNPIKPKKTLNVAIAFFVGLMAGLGIVFLIEYLDNTIKTPEDVTKYTELTVIGAIPKFELIEDNSK